MKLSAKDWRDYVERLRKVNETAAQKMQAYIDTYGIDDMERLVDYAFALATTYGEANGALACEMYDAVAEASNVNVPPAEMAPTATYEETAQAMYGTLMNKYNTLAATVGRLTKQVSADTMLQNGLRDGAKFAWIPHGGETCAFCITLASNGWQNVSKRALKNGHAEHIHANCHCEYAISFDADPKVEGYDPDKYLRMYYGAPLDGQPPTPRNRINALSRMLRKEQVNNEGAEDVIKIPKFVPASSIPEAEAFARTFTSDNSYTKVDFKGVDLECANEINRALNDVLSQYEPKYKLRNITPMNMREKRFKGSTADAAYQWAANDLFFNKGYYKSQKEYKKHLSQVEKLHGEILPNIDMLLEKKKNDSSFSGRLQFKYLTALKTTGRSNVSGGKVYETIVHEMGHYLDDTVFRGKYKEAGFDLRESYEKYAQGVSAYSTSSKEEYVAESFLSYWIGETDNLDPNLIKIFKGARK